MKYPIAEGNYELDFIGPGEYAVYPINDRLQAEKIGGTFKAKMFANKKEALAYLSTNGGI